MENMEESILMAWLRMCSAVSTERRVSELPYNESLICNILYHQQLTHPGEYLTATDLCQRMKMLKSQMNRTLNNMEGKNLIIRERSSQDKRRVFITMNPEQSRIYKRQHLKILRFIKEIAEKIGKEKAAQACEIFNLVADTAAEII